MSLTAGYLLFMIVFLWLTLNAWLLDRRFRRLRMMREALEGSSEFGDALEERLRRMDDYRHDLAKLLQSLDPDLLREVTERGE